MCALCICALRKHVKYYGTNITNLSNDFFSHHNIRKSNCVHYMQAISITSLYHRDYIFIDHGVKNNYGIITNNIMVEVLNII